MNMTINRIITSHYARIRTKRNELTTKQLIDSAREGFQTEQHTDTNRRPNKVYVVLHIVFPHVPHVHLPVQTKKREKVEIEFTGFHFESRDREGCLTVYEWCLLIKSRHSLESVAGEALYLASKSFPVPFSKMK